MGTFSGFSDPQINDQGQILFQAGLSDIPNQQVASGIYLFDPAHGLIKVAQTGDTLAGDLVQFVSIAYPVARVGLNGSGLNNLGQVAFSYDAFIGETNVQTSGIALFSLTAPLPGDTDADGDVDDADLGVSFSNYTGPVGAIGGKSAAQGDTDGDVDDTDLGTAFANYTGPLSPGSTVPEPGSVVVLALGGMMVGRRRRPMAR